MTNENQRIQLAADSAYYALPDPDTTGIETTAKQAAHVVFAVAAVYHVDPELVWTASTPAMWLSMEDVWGEWPL